MKKTYLFPALTILLTVAIYLSPIQAALPVFDSQDQPVPSLAPMLEKVIPAVVNISASTSTTSSKLEELMEDPIFRRFFDFGTPHQQPGKQSRALGSGVIVNAEKGYILTNNHVIEESSGITVTLTDGRIIAAELIGTDPQTDIAVLKVKAENLTAVKMANSDKLRVGDFTVVNNGSIERGILGVQIQDLTPELASAFDVKINKGAVVAQVIPDSAAEKAGIKTGDIIIQVDSRKINSSSGLRSYIGLKSPGDKVKLKLIRGSKQLTLNATIGGKKKLLTKASEHNGFDAKQIHPALDGAIFGNNKGNNPGVPVIEIKPKSPAWHAGLRTDDTLVAINRYAVNSLDDIKRLGKPGRQQRNLALNIYRGDSALFIVLR